MFDKLLSEKEKVLVNTLRAVFHASHAQLKGNVSEREIIVSTSNYELYKGIVIKLAAAELIDEGFHNPSTYVYKFRGVELRPIDSENRIILTTKGKS